MKHAGLWVAALLLVFAYPVSVWSTEGTPSFPSRDDCVIPATTDGDIDAVFGYFDGEREATVLRDRALEVGFAGTTLAWNGCGRVRVAVGGIPTLEVGREFAEQARGVGLEVTLEQSQ